MDAALPRQRVARWLSILVCCGASACAMQPATDADLSGGEPYDAEQVAPSASALKSSLSKPTDYPAAVWLERMVNLQGAPGMGCSGAMIAPYAIATAAHCVSDVVPAAGGWMRIWAEVMRDGARRCISAVNVNGFTENCQPGVNDHAATVWVRYPPNYTGDGDTHDDIAILVLPQNTAYFKQLNPASECSWALREGAGKPSCYYRFYRDTFDDTIEMDLYGFGKPTNQIGILNRGWTRIDWYGSQHFLRETIQEDLQRLCLGDSGGPAAVDKIANLGTSYELLLGVASNGSNLGGDDCAMAGGKERWNRSGAKIWLAEEAIRVARNVPNFVCIPFNTSTGHEYVRCF